MRLTLILIGARKVLGLVVSREKYVFTYMDFKTKDPSNYPGGGKKFIYIVFELKPDYIDDPDKKVYKTYDGSMKPLQSLSRWEKKFREKIIRYCRNKLAGLGGEVWIDDVRIK